MKTVHDEWQLFSNKLPSEVLQYTNMMNIMRCAFYTGFAIAIFTSGREETQKLGIDAMKWLVSAGGQEN